MVITLHYDTLTELYYIMLTELHSIQSHYINNTCTSAAEIKAFWLSSWMICWPRNRSHLRFEENTERSLHSLE